MTARLAIKDSATASVIIPLTRGSIAPADLRNYHGLKLELRGDGDYQLTYNSLAGAWTADITGTNAWKTVEVPFASLHHIAALKDGEKQVIWNGTDLTEIEIIDHRDAGTKTWLEIDNVSFY